MYVKRYDVYYCLLCVCCVETKPVITPYSVVELTNDNLRNLGTMYKECYCV